MQVKIKKLNDKAVIPQYATSGSAGLDLVAVEEKIVIDGLNTYVEYKTGLAVEIPEGYCGLLMSRSSITSNTTLILGNSVGLIDSDYRGEITFRFKPLVRVGAKKYKVGDRIGQLLIIPYPKVELVEATELSDTKRGSGGYGSTGV